MGRLPGVVSFRYSATSTTRRISRSGGTLFLPQSGRRVFGASPESASDSAAGEHGAARADWRALPTGEDPQRHPATMFLITRKSVSSRRSAEDAENRTMIPAFAMPDLSERPMSHPGHDGPRHPAPSVQRGTTRRGVVRRAAPVRDSGRQGRSTVEVCTASPFRICLFSRSAKLSGGYSIARHACSPKPRLHAPRRFAIRCSTHQAQRQQLSRRVSTELLRGSWAIARDTFPAGTPLTVSSLGDASCPRRLASVASDRALCPALRSVGGLRPA